MGILTRSLVVEREIRISRAGEYPLSNSKLVTRDPSCEARLPGSIKGTHWIIELDKLGARRGQILIVTRRREERGSV